MSTFFDVANVIDQFKKQMHNSFDVESRILVKENDKVGFLFLKSFTDNQLFIDGIFLPISKFDGKVDIDLLEHNIVKSGDVSEIKQEQVLEKVLNGNVVIITQNKQKFVAVDIQKYPARIPSEPPTSPVIQGPREGFTEDIKTNITLIRRRLYTEDLVLKQFSVGKLTGTKVIVAYLHGVADKKVVKMVEERLKKIDVDGILDSYYILSFLEDRPNSLFKQIGRSEKPDIIVSKMLEGRVAIIVDGSPIVLSVPFLLIEDMQSSNDYYTNHHYSSLVRIVRMLGIIVAILAPGMYLSLQLYHYNILPLNFLVTVADTTQGLPFTPFLELLFISLLFQILYEVSLRLPSYLGLATSVVGALILGDTGVKAGLISPPGVIVVALAKIALYTAPEQSSQITVLQMVFLLIGGCLGLFGVVTGFIYLVNYLNNLDSFGTPYLSPYCPRRQKDLQDAIIKEPVTQKVGRPDMINLSNKRGQNER